MTLETVRDARDAYFAESGFDESTYTARWVDIDLGPLRFRFPNTAARRSVVPIHDLHHAMTGYKADLAGEGEIAAFEVAGGMGRHWVGWYLNLLTMGHGALLRPSRTFRAFVRGRRALNYYRDLPYGPQVLDQPSASVRRTMKLTEAPRPRIADRLAFAAWTGLSALVGIASLVTVLPVMAVAGALARRGDSG